MADETHEGGAAALAEGQVELKRQKIEDELGSGYVPGGGPPSRPTEAPEEGREEVGRRVECQPEHIRWIVRLVYKWGWKAAAYFGWGIELEDELFPDEHIDAIAEDACPVVERHFPWLLQEIGPEGQLAVTVMETGSVPYMVLQQRIQEQREAEEDEATEPADQGPAQDVGWEE